MVSKLFFQLRMINNKNSHVLFEKCQRRLKVLWLNEDPQVACYHYGIRNHSIILTGLKVFMFSLSDGVKGTKPESSILTNNFHLGKL